jgi:hypothetical protein
MLRTCQTVSAAVNLFNLPASFELLKHPRQETPAGVFQAHPVSDLANRFRFGQITQMSKHFLARHYIGRCVFLSVMSSAFHTFV